MEHQAITQKQKQKNKPVCRDIQRAEEVMRLRVAQLLINEKNKSGEFKIPIHLALGHEAIAVAVSAIMDEEDQLSLPHRNIHYNLARCTSLKAVINEFFLKVDGLGRSNLGSMNLANPFDSIIYTSSILGNNLCVSSGMALANRVNGSEDVVIVVTGDGAMEEGAFYESLLFMASQNLRVIIIVENNGWSLATEIQERRCHVRLKRFAEAFDVRYSNLSGNDVFQYIDHLSGLRTHTVEERKPAIVEVELHTLGDWRMKTEEYPEGKYINYHAGPAPTMELNEWPVLSEDHTDPLHVASQYFNWDQLKAIALDAVGTLTREIQ